MIISRRTNVGFLYKVIIFEKIKTFGIMWEILGIFFDVEEQFWRSCEDVRGINISGSGGHSAVLRRRRT